MKKIHSIFAAVIIGVLASMLFTVSASATIIKETGFGTTWPADSGNTVVEFTARTAKSSDWGLGHKINGSYADTKDYTWPEWGGGQTGFTLTHNSATGQFTLTLDANPFSPAASTTWNSGRASCERVKDIWIRAGSLHNSYTSNITIATLDGRPIDVILTADAAGEINWLHISGESFKDFTLSGTMSMTWTDGERVPQKTQTINLISVIFEGDTDGDGVVDGCDNCPATPNQGQEDCNTNGVGDACDAVNPNANEICDAIDNNCNGQNNEGLSFDVDTDGYTSLDSCEGSRDDCDDTVAAINPGASDANCDGVDQNCSGVDDEDYVSEATSCGVGVCAASGNTSCEEGAVVDSCSPGSPVAETCDGLDNDCDGVADGSENLTQQCGTTDVGACSYGTETCNDSGAWIGCDAIEPSAEICDDIDNNCDGNIDEGVLITFYMDYDGDTFGGTNISTEECSAPAGYVSNNDDCDDAVSAVNPDATEVCDGIDNNCDNVVDNIIDGECLVSIQEEYDAIPGSTGIINLVAGLHDESLVLARNISVRFEGEYDYINNEPATTIRSVTGPTMTIINGSATINNVILQ